MAMIKILSFDEAPRKRERELPFFVKPSAAPFIKWAGGKRGIMPSLEPHFPDLIEDYWEPFVGSGAVFFTLAEHIKRATLSDSNRDLALTYKVVKNDVEELIGLLSKHAKGHEKASYYNQVRAIEPETPLEIAARFIYLNKTCYNGLYRVNKAGKFNVPKGSYKNPAICDSERLREASEALQKATIKIGDFSRVVKPKRGDFVYCDPPYDGCFNSYQSNGFSDTEQERLRSSVDSWVAKGAAVMVSNSDTPLIRRLYRAYNITPISAPRAISCKASERDNAKEVIIMPKQ